MTNNRVNVMLTSAGGLNGRANVRALSRAALVRHVVAVDADPMAVPQPAADAFYVVPFGDDPDYPDRIMEICRSEDVKLIIPGSDEEALTLAQCAQAFLEAGIVCAVPRFELVNAFKSKSAMYKLLGEAGIPVPEFYEVKTAQQLEHYAQIMGYPQRPIIVKPDVSRGGRGVWELSEVPYSYEELVDLREVTSIKLDTMLDSMRQAKTPAPLIIMECFRGDTFDVDILAKSGQPLYIVSRRRHDRLNIPFIGCTLECNPSMLKLSKEIGSSLDLTYLYDIDILLDTKGICHLLEVNPRISGSVAATVAAGINLLEFLVYLALGLDVPQIDVPYGTTIKSSLVMIVAE